jgi:hypothetical protein
MLMSYLSCVDVGRDVDLTLPPPTPLLLLLLLPLLL